MSKENGELYVLIWHSGENEKSFIVYLHIWGNWFIHNVYNDHQKSRAWFLCHWHSSLSIRDNYCNYRCLGIVDLWSEVICNPYMCPACALPSLNLSYWSLAGTMTFCPDMRTMCPWNEQNKILEDGEYTKRNQELNGSFVYFICLLKPRCLLK